MTCERVSLQLDAVLAGKLVRCEFKSVLRFHVHLGDVRHLDVALNLSPEVPLLLELCCLRLMLRPVGLVLGHIGAHLRSLVKMLVESLLRFLHIRIDESLDLRLRKLRIIVELSERLPYRIGRFHCRLFRYLCCWSLGGCLCHFLSNRSDISLLDVQKLCEPFLERSDLLLHCIPFLAYRHGAISGLLLCDGCGKLCDCRINSLDGIGSAVLTLLIVPLSPSCRRVIP